MNLDVATVKKDFPLLSGNPDVVYLDSASSSQKPAAVLDAMTEYYETTHANVHRGVYGLAQEATERFEGARTKVARFLGATDPNEVVFTKNVTEAINLLAHSWGRSRLSEGDVVVLTEMEHHANLVPWLMLAKERGIQLRYIPVNEQGELDLSDLDQLLEGARLVSIAGMSNVLGTINPVRRIADAAHGVGALVAVDAAQLVPHVATDVTALGCDFLGFTGHKMCGPTGIGGFWARADLLDEMPPFMGGGEMIRDVRLDGFTPNVPPWKFEAGTPPIAEAIGLGAAVDYLESLGMEAVREHEMDLTGYALRALEETYGDRLTVFGPSDLSHRGGAISFAFGEIHPHDVSQVLDDSGVCVRAGHHCAKPLMRRLGVNATTRASVYVYNDESDVDALVEGLAKVDNIFS